MTIEGSFILYILKRCASPTKRLSILKEPAPGRVAVDATDEQVGVGDGNVVGESGDDMLLISPCLIMSKTPMFLFLLLLLIRPLSEIVGVLKLTISNHPSLRLSRMESRYFRRRLENLCLWTES